MALPSSLESLLSAVDSGALLLGAGGSTFQGGFGNAAFALLGAIGQTSQEVLGSAALVFLLAALGNGLGSLTDHHVPLPDKLKQGKHS